MNESTRTIGQRVTPQDLVEHVLATTTSDDCIVILTDGTSANLRWANNTLTTNGAMHSTNLTVISFVGRAGGVSTGSASGSANTPQQATALVEAADAAAKSADPAEDQAPLAEAAVSPDWSSPPENTDIGVFSELAPGLGSAFERSSEGGRILYGFVHHQMETTYLGSSTGLRLRHVQPTGHITCTGKTSDLSQSAWVGRATRDFTDIDPLALEETLATRLAWGQRQIALPAGRYETILPPEAVADLSIYALRVAAARDAHDGQSVYGRPGGGTRIGERMARPKVAMYSDPNDTRLPAAPFTVDPLSSNVSSVFDNGRPLSKTDWMSDGVLQALLQTSHSARLTDQPVTPFIGNLIVDTEGTGRVDDLVANTERGLLLTCLWYIREVDPQVLLLTGLTRDGVYLVENGEVTGAVNNFRFNESPIDLLNRFTGSSASTPSFSREWGDYFAWTATPALRIPDFNMSSVSQAM